ncbi:(d)CMP kinase [Kutzneria chonburiensis]|uniref:Cytidylate kinase n=1 Tax=Kutzneria chonburiensis TaxID=1483604 RepID=A0ABV6N0W2_9PSEU|nr:(d)CMP kinase [Kutzneria chonburiensis]
MERGELRGVVALDGPSGTGKSTVARKLAMQLGARYLDTGAMYRAATVAVLRAGVDPADADRVRYAVAHADLKVTTDPRAQATTLDGTDVSAEIRSQEVTTAVSPVSAVAEVRAQLVAQQRSIIAKALAEVGGIVVEGRDIGTVVVPDAALKVYLTADAQARAERRTRQDAAAGRQATVDATLADVRRRDTYDSTRAVSPAKAAEDAVELDTTHLDLAGVLAELMAMVEDRGLRAVPTGSAREH